MYILITHKSSQSAIKVFTRRSDTSLSRTMHGQIQDLLVGVCTCILTAHWRHPWGKFLKKIAWNGARDRGVYVIVERSFTGTASGKGWNNKTYNTQRHFPTPHLWSFPEINARKRERHGEGERKKKETETRWLCRADRESFSSPFSPFGFVLPSTPWTECGVNEVLIEHVTHVLIVQWQHSAHLSTATHRRFSTTHHLLTCELSLTFVWSYFALASIQFTECGRRVLRREVSFISSAVFYWCRYFLLYRCTGMLLN